MTLSGADLHEVDEFLHQRSRQVSDGVVAKLEIGMWLVQPVALEIKTVSATTPIVSSKLPGAVFLTGKIAPDAVRRCLKLFLMEEIPYLLVRTSSWNCYIRCNGETRSAHCDDDHDSTATCCKELAAQCGSGHPELPTD